MAEGLLLGLLISCISMIFFDGRDRKASWSLRSPAALVLIFASLAAWVKDLLGDLFKRSRAFFQASGASRGERGGGSLKYEP